MFKYFNNKNFIKLERLIIRMVVINLLNFQVGKRKAKLSTGDRRGQDPS